MPRQALSAISHTFIKGYITEATGLNFPDKACTDVDNVKFELPGTVIRRKGIDLEVSYDTLTFDRTASAIRVYPWRNVAGDGNITILVLQAGDTLYFYDLSSVTSVSLDKLATSIDLNTYMSGTTAPDPRECQFAAGGGYLFVVHPDLEPFYVSYDATTQTPTATAITISIRDFKGVDDSLDTTDRPSTLTTAHKYNLYNQGWTDRTITLWNTDTISVNGDTTNTSVTITATDVTSIVPGMTVTGTGIPASTTVETINSPTSYDLSQAATATNSATSLTYKWNNYPSNSDVWWLFKNSSEQFKPATTAASVDRGNTPAPNGHFILEAFNQDRDAASGLSGIADVTAGDARPTCVAFFQGRVFYSGVSADGYNSKIYFSQIIENNDTDQFGMCYQRNDPTSETLFDLLPSDGGVIDIIEVGTIIKLVAIQGSLLVFSSQGVFSITGSQGLGFTATDYTVAKLSSVKALSHTSFVDVFGYPAWWNEEGIYVVQPDQDRTALKVQSLTDRTIKTYYQSIESPCKKLARGYFDLVSSTIQWIYNETQPSELEDQYEFNKILVFNMLTGAFYKHTVSTSDVKMNGVFVIETLGGELTLDQIIDGSGNTVIDASTNNVIVYGALQSTSVLPIFKYLVSYESGGSYEITFADERDTRYVDWYSYDSTGVNYDSYFVTGYALFGEALRLHQTNYINVYTSTPEACGFYLQAQWNYATSGDGGDWSTEKAQTFTLDYSTKSVSRKKVRLRGEGEALQLKFSSQDGLPFYLIGWSMMELVNAVP